MSEIKVCRIPLDNASKSITVYSKWNDSEVSFKIIYHVEAWKRKISSDEIEKMCSFTQYSLAEYVLETKRALTTNGGAKDFTYSFKDSELIWKKIIDSSQNIRVKFGCLRLEKVSLSDHLETIIDFAIKERDSTEEKNSRLEKENERLRNVNLHLRGKIEELVSFKTKMEEDLYSKFMLLLNAKKEKISDLERNINSSGYTALGNTSNENITEEHKTSNKSPDLYGSETDIDSDEEKHLPISQKGINYDIYGSETELDTDEEAYKPSSSKVKRMGSPVIVQPHEDELVKYIDDLSAKSTSENKACDTLNKDIFLPIRPKKNLTTKFSKRTSEHSEVTASTSTKQNLPVISDKNDLSEETKTEVNDTKGDSQSSDEMFDIDDLISEM